MAKLRSSFLAAGEPAMPTRSVTAFALTAAFAGAAAAQAASASPDVVLAAARAFAKDGLELGSKASFLKHSAPDAIILAPDPTSAQAFYGARPDAKPPKGAKLE